MKSKRIVTTVLTVFLLCLSNKEYNMLLVKRARSIGTWIFLLARTALTFPLRARWLSAAFLLMVLITLPSHSQLSGSTQALAPEAAVQAYVASLHGTLPIERYQILSKVELRSTVDIRLALDRYDQSYATFAGSNTVVAPTESPEAREEAIQALPVGSFFMTLRYFLKPGAHLTKSKTGFELTVVREPVADVALFVKKLPSGGYEALPDSLVISSLRTAIIEVGAGRVLGVGSISLNTLTVDVKGWCNGNPDYVLGKITYYYRLGYSTPMIVAPGHKGTFEFNLPSQIVIEDTDPNDGCGLPVDGFEMFSNSQGGFPDSWGNAQDPAWTFFTEVDVDGASGTDVDYYTDGTVNADDNKGEAPQISFSFSYGPVGFSVSPPQGDKWLTSSSPPNSNRINIDIRPRAGWLGTLPIHGLLYNGGNLKFRGDINVTDYPDTEEGAPYVELCTWYGAVVSHPASPIYKVQGGSVGCHALALPKYVRANALKYPSCLVTASRTKVEVGSKVELEVKVTNNSSALELEDIYVRLDNYQPNLSVDQPTKPISSIPIQGSASRTFTLTAESPGSTTPGVEVSYYFNKSVTEGLLDQKELFCTSVPTIGVVWLAEPTGLTATASPSASSSQIKLQWNDKSNNEDGFEIEIERKDGPGGKQTVRVGPNVKTYQHTGLPEGATYCYRVRAYSADGHSDYSEMNCTVTPPRAPSNLTATATSNASSSWIRLTWKNNSNIVEDFDIFRSTTGTYWELIASLDRYATAYTDSDLREGVTYYYQVQAYRMEGGSSDPAEARPTTPPRAPSSLTATAVSSSEIKLEWKDNSNIEEGFKIEIERKDGAGGKQTVTVGRNVRTYRHTGLPEGATYEYQVRAYKGDGRSYAAGARATTPPHAPWDLTATAASGASWSQIILNWTDNSAAEDGFEIEINGGMQTVKVGRDARAYEHAELSEGATYCYRVRAYKGDSYSDYSNPACATTPPRMPSNSTATAVSSNRINLKWRDNSNIEHEFKIERKMRPGDSWVVIATVGANVTTYQDMGLLPVKTYYYQVTANSAAGYSYSDPASAITYEATPVLVTNTNDSGPGSLREAINYANGNGGTDRIDFNIPSSDLKSSVWTISLLSPLPKLTENSGTHINGASQTSFGGDTNPEGPEVVIDGKSAGATADGFWITSDNNTMEGLTITGFRNGILIDGGSNNMIGPDNVISGNRSDGVAIINIAGDATGNRICANSIFDNVDLGIDLRGNGVSPNDPGDPDVGPNLLMNFPENIEASSNYYRPPGPPTTLTLFSSTTTTVSGTIDSPNPSSALIKVFFNDREHREGKTYAGCTHPNTKGEWSLTVPGYAPYVTATATGAGGNTSEFSEAKPVYILYGGIGVYSGNETWLIGSKQTIRWGSSGFAGPVKIEQLSVRPLSPGGFHPSGLAFRDMICSLLLQCDPCGRPSWPIPIYFAWVTLFESTPNDGEEQITVTGTPAPISVLRISSVDNPRIWAVSENIVLSGQPDFVVKDLVVTPSTIPLGSMALVTFNIVNQGIGPADPAKHEVWLRANQTTPGGISIPADLPLGAVNTGTLAPGASESFRVLTSILPIIAPGTAYIRVIADAKNEVSESNETNNTAQFQITIKGLF